MNLISKKTKVCAVIIAIAMILIASIGIGYYAIPNVKAASLPQEEITRTEIDELAIIIMDLQMAISVKEQIIVGEERGLVNFSDGSKITLSIPKDVETQLDNKIDELLDLLVKQAKGLENRKYSKE